MRKSVAVASIVALGGLLTVGQAEAAVLAQYTFSPDTTGPNLAPTTVDPLVTAGNINTTGASANAIIQGDGNNTATGSTSADSQRLRFVVSNPSNTNYGSYFQFTVDPVTSVDLDTLTLDAAPAGGSERGFSVFYSFDGFATAGTQIGSTVVFNSATAYAFNNYSYNLTDEVANATQSPVTFRIAQYSATATVGIEYDNITVNGSAVPEPASLGLL
ncbi:MAG TPA: hypothetical protein VK324_05460, partial [Tepidisphaeraceae bacterium]|nr:hypothetical protein [Tepidisphaeraceae bacterium]